MNRVMCLACVSLITKHLLGLKFLCQSYSHFISEFKSFCSSCESISFFISLYSTQSSANRRIDEWILFGLALPCLGPLAPRGAVGACHDGLPRQFSPLLPIVCHGLSLSEGFAGPLCDVITPALFRPAPSSTAFDCSL